MADAHTGGPTLTPFASPSPARARTHADNSNRLRAEPPTILSTRAPLPLQRSHLCPLAHPKKRPPRATTRPGPPPPRSPRARHLRAAPRPSLRRGREAGSRARRLISSSAVGQAGGLVVTMGTLLRPGPAASPLTVASASCSSSSSAQAVAGRGARHLPRLVSVAVFRSPTPRVLEARWRRRDTVVRSDVVAGSAAAAAAGDSASMMSAMVVVHPFVLLFDRYRRRAQHYIAKIWATLTIAMFYKLEVEGMENLPPNSSPAVYVANHQSFLDIYTLLTLGRGAFSVATKTGAPVIPITLIGTGKLMPSGMEGSLNSGSVKVIIHEPIQGNEADALCSEARNVIADTLLRHGYGVH
ncbi:hypothetical protein PR202_gb07074 [Eleusine coracana subsp. coracana]|uniref:Phospholipid/glycerol acyltransferase domain-containing protein n=1 Tax=Eleusine coracana subsp. coracana TaxID=191504 RepID=A0AAV5EC14_ELECO|nr:hypothetical protein PR202_gb07074 [Eleusine coracana subsp. coracana]